MDKLSKILFFIIIVLVIIFAIVFINDRKEIALYKDIVKSDDNLMESYSTTIQTLRRKLEKYTTSDENVLIEVLEHSIKDSGITVLIKDKNSIPYEWKEEYYLETKVKDEWKSVEKIENANSFNMESYVLDTNGEVEREIDWSNIYGQLSAGTYRILFHTNTDFFDYYLESDEFEIK